MKKKYRLAGILLAIALLLTVFPSTQTIFAESIGYSADGFNPTVNNQWYDIDMKVEKEGYYDIKLDVDGLGNRFQFSLNGCLRGTYLITAGDDNKTTGIVRSVYLSKGNHVFYFNFPSANGSSVVNKVRISPAERTIKAFVAGTSEYSSDLIVAIINAKAAEYGAKGDGRTDDTQAIQKALNDAYLLGGGTVFLPAGKYRLDEQLYIPPNVVLRGQWVKPSDVKVDENGIRNETLMLIYGGKGQEDSRPTITIGAQGCLMDMSFWYPEQSFEQPIPYPWLVAEDGAVVSVRNITAYNAYRGINVSTKQGSAQYVENFYGTILYQGLVHDKCLEITDDIGIYFNNGIWAASKLDGAPKTDEQQQKLREFTSMNAVGVLLGRLDEHYMYDIDIDPDDFKVGIQTGVNLGTPDPRFVAHYYGTMTKIHETTLSLSEQSQGVTLITDDVPGTENFNYERPPEKRGKGELLIDAREFGAAGDGLKDDTKSIQQAIDTAYEKGGGTVYLLPGSYRVDGTITVKSGVELRGNYESKHHASAADVTEIVIFSNRGKTEGDNPVIIDGEGGIHGLTFRYPEQNHKSIEKYPTTIVFKGQGGWLEYIAGRTGYEFIKISGSECRDILLRFVWAYAANTGIYIGGGAENVTLESCFISYAAYTEQSYRGSPLYPKIPDFVDDYQSPVSAYSKKNTTAYVFGDCSNITWFSCFTFLTRVGIDFRKEESGFCRDSVFYRVATDHMAKVDWNLEAGDNLSFVGISPCGEQTHIKTPEDFSGKVNIYGRNLIAQGSMEYYGDGIKIYQMGVGQNQFGEENFSRSAEVEAEGNHADRLTDGNRGTGWEGYAGEDEYQITIRLEESKTVGRVELWHSQYGGFGKESNLKDFSIQYSADGTQWKEIKAYAGNSEKITSAKLKAPISAQYIRVIIKNTDNSADFMPRLQEIKVLSPATKGSEGRDLNNILIAIGVLLVILMAAAIITAVLLKNKGSKQKNEV